jgi:hypothetical protein
LPVGFYPGAGRKPLAFHARPERWLWRGARAELRASSRGQEFVLDGDEYPEAIRRAVERIRS